jgi:chemotaxis family two-component system response regulator PixG
MTTESNPKTVSIDEFVASKQIELFQGLKQNRFSGQIIFRDYQATEWSFVLYLGRILYVMGGNHPIRRWRRNLAYYFPQITAQLQRELASIGKINNQDILISWDYHLLSCWVKKNKIDSEQTTKMIRAIVTEVLFDITQARDITYYVKPEKLPLEQTLAMIDSEQQIIEAWKLWQEWQETRIADFSPNLAPRIKQPEVLQEKTSAKTYQTLSRLLDGKHTLRDIAFRKQTGLLLTARSMIPYLQLGFLELVEIPDLPLPIAISKSADKSNLSSSETLISNTGNHINENIGNSQQNSVRNNKPLIACIETSFIICQIMKKIITSAGYNYISSNDPLQAIAIILDARPDIIFISLELTEFTGYDLCGELRQLPDFNHTPIILFSKNVNLVDRVKAKMAGCSELFDKPLEAQSVLQTIAKYTQ